MIVGDTIMESRMMILDTAHTVRSGCTGADNVVVWSAAFDARVVDQDVQCAQVLAHGIDMSPISSAASAELTHRTSASLPAPTAKTSVSCIGVAAT